MKLLYALLVLLAASPVYADGFRCVGSHFKVKLFNQTRPKKGTKNPAALVVYEKNIGTVAALHGKEITKSIQNDTVTFEGLVNHYINGRYMYVVLEVSKKQATHGRLEGYYVGRLTLNREKTSVTETVACSKYLKNEKR